VLLGTDYRADLGEADPVGYIERVSSLSQTEKDRMLGKNAARLLKIAS
jgi:predicted TIM-barrel fold metal-dependent hydrolase